MDAAHGKRGRQVRQAGPEVMSSGFWVLSFLTFSLQALPLEPCMTSPNGLHSSHRRAQGGPVMKRTAVSALKAMLSAKQTRKTRTNGLYLVATWHCCRTGGMERV